MLRCVVGRIRARSGSVLVFGLRPGDSLSEVPGRDVGYMPQEISIYEDFTIEETLVYFGRINRMHHDEITKRIEFLLQFLDLPSKKRLVVNLRYEKVAKVTFACLAGMQCDRRWSARCIVDIIRRLVGNLLSGHGGRRCLAAASVTRQ